MPYQEVVVAVSVTSGEWQVGPEGGEVYADLGDLLDACRDNVGEVWELGVDELPEDIEDIRGRIHNEPERVYAFRDDGATCYFGIREV